MQPALLNTKRSLIKTILLSIQTFGIYSIVLYSGISVDINIIAHRFDGKKTMHYCWLLLLGPITLGIAALVWGHRLCARMDYELRRRGLAYRFTSGTFWGWNILGCLCLAGPFIFLHKLCKAMNLLCEDYNARG